MERSGVGRNYKRGRRSTKNFFFSMLGVNGYFLEQTTHCYKGI